MKIVIVRLPIVIFATAIAVWGLASIPDGSGNDKTSSTYRRGGAGGHARYGVPDVNAENRGPAGGAP